MSQDRKAKLKKREQRQRRAEQRKRDLVDDALKHSGMEQAFKRLPQLVQDRFRLGLLPPPELVLAPSVEGCPETLEIQNLFLPILHSTPSILDEVVSAMEMYRFLSPLNNTLQGFEKAARDKRLDVHATPFRELFALAPLLSDFMSKHEMTVIAYFLACWSFEMVRRSRLDERVFWFTQAHRVTRGGKHVQQFVLHQTEPERTQIVTDGAARPAFR